MSLSLTLIRAHLNLDDDTDTEFLTHYRGVAEVWVAAYVGAPFLSDFFLMAQAAPYLSRISMSPARLSPSPAPITCLSA